MVDIAPKPQMTAEQAQEQLQAWYEMQRQLGEIRNSEAALRRMLYQYFFPTPEEGVNRVDIGFGMDLKLEFKISRDVDVALLDAHAKDFQKAGIDTTELVKYKPQLVVGAYRELTDKQREVFDQCLIIKDDGLQGMHIVSAKEREVPTPEQFAAAIAVPEPQPTFLMTAKAGNITREQFHENGWTDDLLVENGYMIAQVPLAPPPPPHKAPAKKAAAKRGRPRKVK